MSHNPFQDWSQDNARLLKTDLTQERYSPVSVAKAYENAVETIHSIDTTSDQYVIPLFEPDAPKPTQEYVYYKPESQKVKIYDSGNHSIAWLPPGEVSTTELGQRLKWWLPPDEQDFETLSEEHVPPESVSPVTNLSKSESSEFFDEMLELVQQERIADKQANREQYEALGLNKAIHRGVMAGPLIPLGTAPYEGGRAFKFQLTSEESDDDTDPNLRDDAEIFPDNEYLVGVRGHESISPIEMEAVYVGDTDLWLRPLNKSIAKNSPKSNVLTDDEATVWVHDLVNPLPYNRRRDAIHNVKRSRNKRQLLTGNQNAVFSSGQHAIPDSGLELNISQQKALVWAEAAEDCFCIHGPPGTGKTRTLTAYIRDAVAREQRVLVTAHSNQAVDNLLVGDSTVDEPEEGTLHAIAQDDETDITISRSGTNSEDRVVNRYYQGVPSANADIVAATTSGAARFSTDSFDVGIVDEATQAAAPRLLSLLTSLKSLFWREIINNCLHLQPLRTLLEMSNVFHYLKY
ncbi:AAA domain-containing protein [Halomicroarcula sp. GCM10025709]|uniref:AAA domain-containing protein n=1 Tax=Halomicroarcula sp. GCM10025709 TaxID=3252669 RepID=UPI00361CFC28